MKRDDFVELTMSFCGLPFVKYTNEKSGLISTGYDCSGFVNAVLIRAGYPESIPRHASQLFDSFGSLVHQNYVLPGDLVFFSKKGTYPSHVGIMVGDNTCVHASSIKKIICVKSIDFKTIKMNPKLVQLYYENPIGFKRIMVDNDKRYKTSFLK